MKYWGGLKDVGRKVKNLSNICLNHVFKSAKFLEKCFIKAARKCVQAYRWFVPHAKKELTNCGTYIKKQGTRTLKWLSGKVSLKNLKLIIYRIKKIFTKEKLKSLIQRISCFFSKENLKKLLIAIRGKFTKEKLKDYINNIKKGFSRENIRIKYNSIKENLITYRSVYITFIVLILILVIPLSLYIKKGQEAAVQVVSKYVITDNTAEELYFKGEYDKAIEEYNKLTLEDEKEGLWYAKISEVYSVKGDIENSRHYLQKAYEAGANNAEVINYVVFTEMMNKDYMQALSQGEEALKQFPKDKKLIKTMFTVYMANNNLEKAQELVKTYPVSSTSAYDRAEYARMLMMIGNKEEGFRILRTAWFIDKDEYKVYDILAQLSLYNRDELLEYISNLSNEQPENIAYKMWLTKIYSMNESAAAQAEKILQEMEKEDTGKLVIKLIKAKVLQNLGRNEEAEKLLAEVIENNKDDYRSLHTAGWYYFEKGDYLKADEYCRQSIIKNKDYTDNYGFLMPEILKQQNKTNEGEPYFRTALYKEPYNYNIMITLADYYWHTTKNADKAMDYFKQAEIVMPKEPEIKYSMAFINLSNGSYEEAVKLLKQCISLSDSTAKYHRTLGTVYLLDKKPKEAIEEIRYAYGSDESDILTLNNAGCYYITQDVNLQKGEFNLRKAVEGINDSTDAETASMIKANYQKAKELIDKYKSGKSNETLKIPDFQFFY
jgi:predicted Zn-dependent protease